MLRLNDTAPLGSLSIAPRVAKRQGKSRHSWANLMHTGSFILSVAQDKASEFQSLLPVYPDLWCWECHLSSESHFPTWTIQGQTVTALPF